MIIINLVARLLLKLGRGLLLTHGLLIQSMSWFGVFVPVSSLEFTFVFVLVLEYLALSAPAPLERALGGICSSMLFSRYSGPINLSFTDLFLFTVAAISDFSCVSVALCLANEPNLGLELESFSASRAESWSRFARRRRRRWIVKKARMRRRRMMATAMPIARPAVGPGPAEEDKRRLVRVRREDIVWYGVAELC